MELAPDWNPNLVLEMRDWNGRLHFFLKGKIRVSRFLFTFLDVLTPGIDPFFHLQRATDPVCWGCAPLRFMTAGLWDGYHENTFF